ncbi:MAG: M20 family metallopeptidase [Promethearchaeota archaeon]
MMLSSNLRSELKNILIHLVQTPTVNPPGRTGDVIDFLISEVFKEKEGFENEVVVHMKKNVKLHNLVSRIGSGKKKIILSGHFDVVPVGDTSKWTHPPFSAKIVGDKIYGRGSADMKGGLTSLIGVLKNLSKNERFLEKYELVFLGTADEESGMSGSLTLKNKGIMDNAILLIIAEPTNLNIGIAEKGLLWIRFKIQGKSVHGSTPEQGINAIEGALNLIPKLYNCLEDKTNQILGSSTLNVGLVKGGTKINIVPDYSELDIDFRLIPEQSLESLINKLRQIKSDPCSLKVEILNNQPSVQTDHNHIFIKKLANISGSELIGLPYATDASNFIDPSNPVPFVIFGPGDPENAHKVNESIEIEQVFQSIEILTETLLETYLK